MNQLTLFDTPAHISRKSDPITSQKSAAETEPHVDTCEGRMLTVLREAKWALTGREAGRKCELRWPDHEADTYRKRISKMVRDGLAVEAGEKVCEVSGKRVTTYTAKEQP
jgi:nicotinate-nucleotide pyrophosphorylase